MKACAQGYDSERSLHEPYGIVAMRILIVEDDAILADGLLHSIREARYILDLVTTGVLLGSATASHLKLNRKFWNIPLSSLPTAKLEQRMN